MPKIIPIPIGPIYNEGPCRGMVHVIEKGDTLYRLGKRYHVSVGQLMFANPFVNVYNLQIGDELCIPISIQPRNPESRMQGELMDGAEMPEAGIPEGMEPESRISGRMCQKAPAEPMPNGRMPVPDAGMPMAEDRMPAQDTGMPVPDGRMPAQDAGLPVPDGRMPAQGAGIPMELGPMPTEQAGLPEEM